MCVFETTWQKWSPFTWILKRRMFQNEFCDVLKDRAVSKGIHLRMCAWKKSTVAESFVWVCLCDVSLLASSLSTKGYARLTVLYDESMYPPRDFYWLFFSSSSNSIRAALNCSSGGVFGHVHQEGILTLFFPPKTIPNTHCSDSFLPWKIDLIIHRCCRI